MTQTPGHSPSQQDTLPVRLSSQEIASIRQAFRDSFEPADRLWLFGSRVDLDKRGGDIDLYIETSLKSPEAVVAARSAFYTKLMLSLGEQKIDLVIRYDQEDLPIYTQAKAQGIQLL